MKQKYLIINKEGPLIFSESIQAKIFPEISNTHCWILSNSSGKHPGRYALIQWELVHGDKPKNMCILHKCDNINGPCVNPLHLFLGTMSDNIKDCVSKKRYKNGCTSVTAKKAWGTRVKNGNTSGFITTSETARKGVLTKRKKGISVGGTTESNKKSWETRRKRNQDKGPKFIEAAKKGWETRRKNGNFKTGNQYTKGIQ